MGTLAEDLLARAARPDHEPKPRQGHGLDAANRTNAWPETSEALLIRLYNEGASNAEIAPRVGKTANAVGIKINRLKHAGRLGARPDDKR